MTNEYLANTGDDPGLTDETLHFATDIVAAATTRANREFVFRNQGLYNSP